MRPVSRVLGLLAICTLASTGASGQSTSDSYYFLNISTSSHAYALGGSGAAIIDEDVTLADQNPALIGPELESQLAVNYMHYLGSANFAGVRYGMAAGETGAWAVGLRYLNFGSIHGLDEFGTEIGDFTPQDLVVEGTYSRDINERFRGGINLKMVYSNYEQYTAFALAADLGINYYYDEYDLSLSLVARNLGGQLKKFAEKGAKMPITLDLAYMQGLGTSPFSLAITAADLTHWKLPYYDHDSQNAENRQQKKQSFGSDFMRHIILGLQYSPSEKFYAAIGYNYRTRTDMGSYHRSFLSGFSAGVGLRVKDFSIGVAYAQPHASGSTLMLNLAMGFGSLLR